MIASNYGPLAPMGGSGLRLRGTAPDRGDQGPEKRGWSVTPTLKRPIRQLSCQTGKRVEFLRKLRRIKPKVLGKT
mgnify:CR=1 FL=1